MSVYSLTDPRTSKVRYVGHSRVAETRYRHHVHGKPAVRDWYSELKHAGLTPLLHVYSFGTEAQWIEKLRPDLNVAAGRGTGFKEIKVRPTAQQKEAFERAAERCQPSLSLNQWLIMAGLEKLKRDAAPGKRAR